MASLPWDPDRALADKDARERTAALIRAHFQFQQAHVCARMKDGHLLRYMPVL